MVTWDIPSAILRGVYSIANLGEVQENEGVCLFWQHRLADAAFVMRRSNRETKSTEAAMTISARCRRSALALLAGLPVALLVPSMLAAQELTGRPIRMLVGLAAGGATDVMARIVAQKLAESLHTAVVVENKPGGNFIPMLRELTNAAPDGHTLIFISTSTLIAQPLIPDYPFDLIKLTPVTQVATGPLILVARKDLPIKSVRDLIAYGKKNPGKLTFGAGGGAGSSLFLATELLKAKTGIEATVIPYRGAGPALNDLLGGHIDAMFDAMPVMQSQVKAGTVTALAVTSAARSNSLPDVPTVMEQGVGDYEIAGWFGILGPTGLPPAIAKRLRDEVAKAVAGPDVAAQFDLQGVQPLATEPEDWRKYLQAELARYAKIIKDADIKPE
jgi:tripartite-type tricarboxylate transporter receptor subunit TctC